MKTNYCTKWKKASAVLLGVFCLSFLVFFTSCEKDEEGGGTQLTLKDNPEGMTVSSAGTSETFTVLTSGPWKVEPLRNEKWVKIEPREGNGEGTFTVTIKQNTTPEARTSALTFLADGKLQNAVLRIEQEAYDNQGGESESYVNLDGLTSLNAPDAGLYQRFTVRSTGDWKIEIPEDVDWLKIDPMEGSFDAGVNVTVDLNQEVEARTAALTFYLNGEAVPGVFEVKQEGMEVILFEDFNWLNYGSAIFPTTTGEKRIDTWSTDEIARGWTYYQVDEDGLGTDKVPSTYARVGFVKLGKTNFGGDLYSPPLSAIEGTKNLVVRFKAVPYMTSGGTKDGILPLKVGVTGPGTVSANSFVIDNWPNYSTDPNCVAVWLTPEATRSFTITGATAETRIWFLAGKYPLASEARPVNRVFIDDILVAVKKK